MESRIGAVAVTALAHLLAIVALVEGLQQAQVLRESEVFVQFAPHVKEIERAAPPSVALVKPVVIEPAAPSITIAAPAPVAQPAPPTPPSISVMMLPSPPNTSAGGSNAQASWEAALMGKLNQGKHKSKAGAVVLLRFTLDRDGKVLSSRIEKSSGNAGLDQEALAALAAAQPLPRPPPEVEGALLDLIVPLDFF